MFRPDAGAYIGRLTRRVLMRWAWLPLSAVAICAIAATADMRFAYLGLIIALIVYPMALAMVWMAQGAHTATAMLTRPQRWRRCGDNARIIEIELYQFAAEEDDIVDDEEPQPVAVMTVGLDEVKRIDAGADTVALWLRRGRSDGVRLLLAPKTALPDGMLDELNNLLTFKV